MSDFLRYQLPYEYDPGAECPQFEAFLDDVLPEKDSQKTIAEYIGLSKAKAHDYLGVENNNYYAEYFYFLRIPDITISSAASWME